MSSDLYEKFFGELPLWFLLFIATGGFLVVISCPYDVFALNFENGVIVPTSVGELRAISDVLDTNFKPFVMIQYLGSEFPAGLAKVILLSVVVGIFMYLLYDAYQYLSDSLMHGWARKKYYADKWPAYKKAEDAKLDMLITWLVKTRQYRYMEFLGAMKMLTEALLFASGTFFIMNLVLLPNLIIRLILRIPTQSAIVLLVWLGLSFSAGVVSYVIYFHYILTFNNAQENMLIRFDKDTGSGTVIASNQKSESPTVSGEKSTKLKQSK